MQFQIWLDKSNFLTIDTELSATDDNGSEHGREVIAAVITNKKLSDITSDELIDIVAQTVDHLTSNVSPVSPQRDWRDDWLEKTRG